MDLWQWTAACSSVAAVASGLGWWISHGSVTFWREAAQERYDQLCCVQASAKTLCEQRNAAQTTVAERNEDITTLLRSMAALRVERDEARAAVAQALRRDPTTGRFLRSATREADNGGALQH